MSDQLEMISIPSSPKSKTYSDSPVKSASAFKTISEVSVETGVPQHVLRFWESKFSQLRPMKRGGGRRYYRPEDVLLLQRIRRLLQDEGYTIKGVQKVLKERLDAPAIATAANNVAAARTQLLKKPSNTIPQPEADAFPRTRAALIGGDNGVMLSSSPRLVLDVELLSTPSGRERLLLDVLAELRDLRSSLKQM